MNLDIKFQENTSVIDAELQESESLIVDLTEKTGSGGTYKDGYEAGYSEGEAAGQKAEYDKFWDAFQNNGAKTNYAYTFYGWNTNCFFPKYDICPTSAYFFAREMGGEYIDLVARLNECGVKLNFSKATSTAYLFYSACITHLPEIDISSSGDANTLHFGVVIKTIDKFIPPENTSLSRTFGYSSSLVNIVFEGVISQDLNMSWSTKLSVDSMKSAISCLKNHKGTDSEFAYKVTFNENCWTALEADSTSPSGGTWREYVEDLGWNT